MAEKHLKNCSSSLVIRETKIKTTLRFQLTPVRMAKIKTSGDSKCWWGCAEKGTLLHFWWDCKLVKPLWKSTGRFLSKLEIDLPEDQVITLLGIYPKHAPPCHRGRSSIRAGFVCQRDTSSSYHRERSFIWRNASMRSSCKAFSQLVIKGVRAHGRWCHPWAGSLGFYKKVSKPVSNILPRPLHQLLLPDLLEFQSWLPLVMNSSVEV